MADQTSTPSKPCLIQTTSNLEGALRRFQEINQRANYIALSAAIEGARMKGKLATFSIVAGQIAQQALRNTELSEKLESLIKEIQIQAHESVAIRNLELATDLIDKLDRNLFERNCDVQAWAGFDLIQKSLTERTEDTSTAASDLLKKLVSIYVVYQDSFVLDAQGIVVAAANQRQLLRANLQRAPWFMEAIQGKVTVTDVHPSTLTQANSVFYCAPIQGPSGEIIGVLANAFNWDFALEMIDSAGYQPKTKAILINKDGLVIGSSRKSQILTDDANWLEAGELASNKHSGYSVEHARNGAPIAVGFAHTKGYNAYAGKSWSAILTEPLGNIHADVRAQVQASTKDIGFKIESERLGETLMATMKKIDDLVLEINGNNREVKLLAVNASIQAGLAGAEGEGFSIIANEVAALAKRSLNFVEQVNEITSALRGAVESSISVRLVDAAKDTMSKIDRNLFERYCDIQAWATFSKIIEVASGNVSADPGAFELLEKIHKIYEVYHDIYILNLQGDVLSAAIYRSVVGQRFSDKDWFRAGAAGTIYVSDLYTSDTLKSPVMTFSGPIKDASGTIVGVLASRFNCKFLNDIIRATVVDSTSTTRLLNSAGKVIAAADDNEVLKGMQEGLDSSRRGEKSGYFEQNASSFGFARSGAYNTYRGQEWTTVITRPHKALDATQHLSPAKRFLQLLESKSKKRVA